MPYHHGDLRAALLDAAEDLVRERGADGWSLREACTRIGVSPSAAYHHFASRDVLVRALSQRVLARLGTLSAAVPGTDPRQRVIAIAQTYVRWAISDPAVSRLAFSAGEPDAPISPHPHDVLAAELDRLSLPSADFLVWAAMHGLAMLLADGLMRFDDDAAVDGETARLIGALLDGLPAQLGPHPRARSAHTDRRGSADEHGGVEDLGSAGSR
ncbi:TetR/AcrR family transcriptional regulator [Kutzneria sp. CA-103260]|uniref:TetR/AcrR family transcriptional regulator n=1 Tax=Kutzneria sp. CA-103260 TaxID=2802641 RepID=UPI002012F20F|nr:TetR/AcrR family transcriptional regulator [Kutzneria sp. CA-103260]